MNQTPETVDVYTLITNRIIEQLEHATVPWQKPWTEPGLPENLISKKPYRGINVWLLASLNFSHNVFLTFKQAKKIGALIKRGEKSCPVVFWDFVEKKDELTQELSKHPVLKYYTVFNIEQCTDIPPEMIPLSPIQKNEPLLECEHILAEMADRPYIKHDALRAYYNPQEDVINCPYITNFIDSESYYGTLFHELVHSTGHTSRLNRQELMEMTKFGSKTYSQEELTAEMGACYLQSLAGIGEKHFPMNVAYLQGWMKTLNNDKRMVIHASAKAQKAVDYILKTPVYNSNEKKGNGKVEALEERPDQDDFPF